MADLLEYIQWRGDIPFSQVPPTPVDSLIFSAIVYIDYTGLVSDDPERPRKLCAVAHDFFNLATHPQRVRVKKDMDLLLAMADAPRFRDVGLVFYRDLFIPEEETQFAAMTFLLDDDSAFLAFRGTDYSLVGWKEDFNMSFQDFVPAQREALRYTQEFAAGYPGKLRLGGHSKGGNLAVFAAATCEPVVQDRVCAVYNNDGPGFTEFLLGKPGYLRMVPKIQTYIPQSSIIGILLEHEEEYTVIKSSQVSILQHEPYSWEVMGGSFREAEGMDAETVLLDKTIKAWIAGMSREERSIFVDAVFELLEAGGADQAPDLLHPKSIRALFKALNADEQTRSMLGQNLLRFLRNAAAVRAKTFRRKPDSTEISTIG